MQGASTFTSPVPTSVDIAGLPPPPAGGPPATITQGLMPDVMSAIIPATGLYDVGVNPLIISPILPGILIFVRNNEAVPVLVKGPNANDPGVVIPPGATSFFGSDAAIPDHLLLIGGIGITQSSSNGEINVQSFGAFPGVNNVTTSAAAINAALAFAVTNGFNVFIPAGDYYLNMSIFIPSEVLLRGAGQEVTRLILHPSATLAAGIIVNTNWSLANNTPDSRVTVRSLTIDGANVTPVSGQPRGVFFNKTSDSVVKDLYVINTLDDGIRFDNTIPTAGTPPSARSNSVLYNTVDRTGIGGENIMIRSFTADPTNTTQEASHVLDTLIEGNTSIGGQHGILLFNVKGFRVALNTCRDNSERGILMGPDATDGLVVANTVLRAGSTGIHGAYRTKRVTISDNTVLQTLADGSGIGQEGQGIKFYAGFTGIVISGNTCDQNATDGIALLGGAPPVTGGDGSGFTISGNSCGANLRHGIHIRAGTVGLPPPLTAAPIHTGAISGNVCLANLSDGIHVSTNDGTTKPETITIGDNATRDNTGWGLFADNLLNSNIGHNQHTSNGSGGESVSFSGMADYQISHHVGIARFSFGAVQPANGTWNVNDIVFNTASVPGGFIGWVCTTAGSPGTWKTWGPISP